MPSGGGNEPWTRSVQHVVHMSETLRIALVAIGLSGGWSRDLVVGAGAVGGGLFVFGWGGVAWAGYSRVGGGLMQ